MRYPRWSIVRPAIAVDARALIFALSISTGAALIFGLIPALYAGRADVNDALKAGGRTSSPSLGGTRVWGLLVAGEVALASMLLIGAGRSGVGPTRAALRRGAARSGCHGARRPIAADGGDDRELRPCRGGRRASIRWKRCTTTKRGTGAKRPSHQQSSTEYTEYPNHDLGSSKQNVGTDSGASVPCETGL